MRRRRGVIARATPLPMQSAVMLVMTAIIPLLVLVAAAVAIAIAIAGKSAAGGK
jgi:hypothetical protein